jgi:uncharacterized protein (DUF4415 family)
VGNPTACREGFCFLLAKALEAGGTNSPYVENRDEWGSHISYYACEIKILTQGGRPQIVKSGSNSKKRSRTDWKRVDALRDEDIDFSDMPELGPDFFARAIIWPGPKKQITLRIDPDVLTSFRKQGRGYQSTINAVLRKYVEARKHRVG